VRFPTIEEVVGAAVGTVVGGSVAVRRGGGGASSVAGGGPAVVGLDGAEPLGGGRTHDGDEDGQAEEDVATRRRMGYSRAEEKGVTRSLPR
jgi:hypothetical protein